MNRKEIDYKIKYIISKRRLEAETLADNNLNFAMKSNIFSKYYNSYRQLTPEIAKQKVNGENITELLLLQARYKALYLNELGKMKLSEKDIMPQYFCEKCHDKGYIDGEKCTCYINLQKEMIKIDLEASSINTPRLQNISNEIFFEKDKAIYDKIKNYLIEFCNNIKTQSKRIIVFSGASGTGKTYMAESTCKELEFYGYNSMNLSAFALNNSFKKYHTTFDGTTNDIIDNINEIDVLVIDDLGSEPILRNVTLKYLLSIINERIKNNKLTIITTNLGIAQIEKHYGQRIQSRLSNKKNSIIIPFNFEDIRLSR